MLKSTGMKNLFICLMMIYGLNLAVAQAVTIDKTAVEQATQEYAVIFGLQEGQLQQMYQIQETRFRNLAEIEVLKTTNETLYRQKLVNIRNGMEGSIDRMLTPEQRPVLQQIKADRRRAQAAKAKALEESGASKEAIQQAILEMEEQ
jgi:hypothetical protein